jgi:hypothetical protein
MSNDRGGQEEQVLHYVAATADDKDIIGRKINQSSKKIRSRVLMCCGLEMVGLLCFGMQFFCC